jgi:hypothetical protein
MPVIELPVPKPGLVDANGLLEAEWPDPKSRPSRRWLMLRTARREIPFVKIGRFVYFDVQEVHAALIGRHTVGRAA